MKHRAVTSPSQMGYGWTGPKENKLWWTGETGEGDGLYLFEIVRFCWHLDCRCKTFYVLLFIS